MQKYLKPNFIWLLILIGILLTSFLLGIAYEDAIRLYLLLWIGDIIIMVIRFIIQNMCYWQSQSYDRKWVLRNLFLGILFLVYYLICLYFLMTPNLRQVGLLLVILSIILASALTKHLTKSTSTNTRKKKKST